jgi:hypothetical protein
MKIIESKLSRKELVTDHLTVFPTMVKAVVDVENELIAIDAELHADLELMLLEHGSKQENLWGINMFPLKKGNGFIEYVALINIRPTMNNNSMDIENAQIRDKIKKIVDRFIENEA